MSHGVKYLRGGLCSPSLSELYKQVSQKKKKTKEKKMTENVYEYRDVKKEDNELDNWFIYKDKRAAAAAAAI